MTRWSKLCLVLTLAAAGCSDDDPVAPPAPPGGGLGTPLTAAGAIEAQSPLLWSPATDEIIAVASFNDPNSNSLIAVSSSSGARRQLEPLASTPLALTLDGTGLYYATLSLDSTVSRSVELTGGGARRRLNFCGSGCFHAVLPAPLDADRVALYPVADSTALHTLSTGAIEMLTSGYPLAFSPDGTRLLTKAGVNEPIQDAVIFDLGTGLSQPANLGLPDAIGAHLVRWTPAGIEVLYQTTDRQNLVVRHVGTGLDEIVFFTSDTLETPMDWAGVEIAVWTSKAAGSGRSYQLTVIQDNAALVGSNLVVTTTLTPGRPVLSPEGQAAPLGVPREIVYAVDRRLYRSTYTPPVEGAPR